MKKAYALIFCGLVLTACGGIQPTQLTKSVDFSSPMDTVVGKFDAVFFSIPPKDRSIGQQAAGATFYVGSRSYVGKRSEGNVTWEYGTTNPCKDLPQGSNIKARYELIDGSKAVLASGEQNLAQIDTCR